MPAANLPLKLVTKLGSDLFLPTNFVGREALSELFHFEVDVVAARGARVPFNELIGQEAHLSLAVGDQRYFNGIITELSEGASDETFTQYRLVLSPTLWRLTKRAGFRIFQDQSVLDIARTLLTGIDVRVQTVAPYEKRNFTVQYAETDFDFLSRLLEQAGIYYYFEHKADGHTLVLADQSTIQHDLPGPSPLRFDQTTHGERHEGRVTAWRKTQQLCSGKFTHWDYNFHMPDQRLEAGRNMADEMAVGSVTHHLNAGANQDLEMYRFTGGYGALQDSLDVSGKVHESHLQLLFKENEAFARLSMEREACGSLHVTGSSTVGRLLPGFHFTLAGHAHADGTYLLTRVVHRLEQTGWRSGAQPTAAYTNEFAGLPKEMAYRPPCRTAWPKASGVQPAVVVGPKDDELFTDAYGRVKVQFLWDRHGQRDPGSSCWMRVAQAHAGNGFGFVSIPRVGEEVLVGFMGDNPDRPYIVGSVYNPKNPPPFQLPEHATRTVLKSHSVRGDDYQFSGLAIEDQIGKEHLHLHSERDMIVSAEHNHLVNVVSEHHVNVGKVHMLAVGTPIKPPGGSGHGAGPGAKEIDEVKSQLSPHKGGGVDYTGPFDWSSKQASCDLGYYYSMVYGYNGDLTAGLLDEHVFGLHVEVMVNPLGFVGNLSGTVLSPIATTIGSLNGHLEFVLANHTELIYGCTLEGHRGSNVTMNGEPSALTRTLAKITALIEMADYITFGLLDPDDRSFWITDGVTTGLNTLLQFGIVMSEFITFGEKSVEIVTEQMEAEEVAQKETQLNQSLLTLYQDVTRAGNIAGKADAATAKLSKEKISRVHATDEAVAIWGKDIALYGNQSLQLSNGDPNVGVLSLTTASFKIAFSAFGSITLTETGVTIKFGPEAGPSITLNETGIQLTAGPAKITLSPETGIVLQAGTAMISLSPEDGITQEFGEASVELNEAGVTLGCPETEFLIAAAGITIDALMMEIFIDSDYLLSAATSTTLIG